MLSVLIPVYNFDIITLIKDLHQQLTESGIPFEILCFDDGSKENFKQINRNITLSSYYPITYFELEQNLGRARIRNVLAAKAQYPYLLFMDCDSKVIHSNYIEYYIEYLQHDTLLYGGRSYAPTPPDQPELLFHWLYGTHREAKNVITRSKQPYHSFMTNNFLIPKSIFDSIKFDERLTKYGHEDTLFGLELQKHNIKILHLDNPLEHIGLEEVNTFLEKTQQGIQNLAELAKEHPDLDTTLIKTWKYLQKWRLTGFIYFILQLILPFIQRNLKSGNPSLKLFDLYKLSLLIQEMKKK